mmetsp:Transcript_26191/g.44660  ORF Transcript_26191/g.44660 Transcript_26191/m.44660 type:complete len:271 (+) Transcript_26191:188-1000(+)
MRKNHSSNNARRKKLPKLATTPTMHPLLLTTMMMSMTPRMTTVTKRTTVAMRRTMTMTTNAKYSYLAFHKPSQTNRSNASSNRNSGKGASSKRALLGWRRIMRPVTAKVMAPKKVSPKAIILMIMQRERMLPPIIVALDLSPLHPPKYEKPPLKRGLFADLPKLLRNENILCTFDLLFVMMMVMSMPKVLVKAMCVLITRTFVFYGRSFVVLMVTIANLFMKVMEDAPMLQRMRKSLRRRRRRRSKSVFPSRRMESVSLVRIVLILTTLW